MLESLPMTATLDAVAPRHPHATRPFAPFEWMVAFRHLRARNAQKSISVIAAFSFLGIVRGVETPLTDYEAVAERVGKVPGVTMALPLVEGQGFASSPYGSSGALARGDPGE